MGGGVWGRGGGGGGPLGAVEGEGVAAGGDEEGGDGLLDAVDGVFGGDTLGAGEGREGGAAGAHEGGDVVEGGFRVGVGVHGPGG